MSRADGPTAEDALRTCGQLLGSLIWREGAGDEHTRIVYLTDEQVEPVFGVLLERSADGDGWALIAHQCAHEEDEE